MTTINGLGRAAVLGLALGLGHADSAFAGIAAHDTSLADVASAATPVQYGYGPYGRPYRPYGFYARRRFYNNHFGPGAAKERYRTGLTFCRNQPSRC